MKITTCPAIVARCLLAAAVASGTGAARAGDIDCGPLITVAPRQRDADGGLLPLQSYDETIRRGMSFLLDDHAKWFKGPPDSIVDEQGVTQLPWVYYSNLQHDGTPFTGSVDRFVSYPAFHHALLIRTFVRYAKYAGDQRALEQAVKLADWDIAHSTPADWPYARLPWSTFQEKKPGGFRDRTGLMPDKAAIMALAYLELHEATGEKRFRDAAEAIGATLVARQRPDGTWPFRVDPRTEKVIEDYTSSVIYAVMLFEKLDALSGQATYRAARDKTWNWLVNGPIKTKDFRGFYEDIPPSPDGRTNYDCLDTIRYLVAHRTPENGYLALAVDLEAWVEKVFLDRIKGFEPAEGIREQLQCNVVMGIHSLNWASMLLDLSKATGDETLRRRAIQTANYVTYYLQPDNRIVVGFQYSQWWYSCHAGVVLYLLDFAKAMPDGTTRAAPAKAVADKPREQAVIVNHKTWTDTDGNPILAHDGGITRFGDTFYWYGTSYAGNPTGKFGMMAPKLWNGVLVYSSTNLVDWTYRGLAVKRPDKGFGNLGTSGRPHVIYNDKTKKHVMWYWLHLQYPAAIMMVATADKPEGPFTVVGLRQVGTENGFASDHNVFKDDDGKAYLVYCDHETPATRFAPHANGRYAIRIDSLTDDYLATNQEGVYAIDKGCEAPAMIKYDGTYIVAASGVEGWSGTETHYVMAAAPLGPYSQPKLMSEQKTWTSQLTSLFFVKESNTLVAMCDQWWIPDKTDLNKSRYFWIPVQVDAAQGTARMLNLPEWNPWKPQPETARP